MVSGDNAVPPKEARPEYETSHKLLVPISTAPNAKAPAPLQRGGRFCRRENYSPAAAFRAAALSVRSQVKPSSEVRPKWP